MIVTKKCALCGNKFSRATYRGYDGGQYCGRRCGNKAKSRMAGAKTYNDAMARRALTMENVQQPKSYRLVPLDKPGRHAKLDSVDFDAVQRIPWRLTESGYAVCDRSPRRMHRLIMARIVGRPLQPSEKVDHKNRDKLDNRRSNLRLATVSQNGYNAAWKRNESGYIGVIKREWKTRTTYSARVNVLKQVIIIGTFDDPEDAAYARDQFAIALYGEFARLNIL